MDPRAGCFTECNTAPDYNKCTACIVAQTSFPNAPDEVTFVNNWWAKNARPYECGVCSKVNNPDDCFKRVSVTNDTVRYKWNNWNGTLFGVLESQVSRSV
jgi:hypothetical protein